MKERDSYVSCYYASNTPAILTTIFWFVLSDFRWFWMVLEVDIFNVCDAARDVGVLFEDGG